MTAYPRVAPLHREGVNPTLLLLAMGASPRRITDYLKAVRHLGRFSNQREALDEVLWLIDAWDDPEDPESADDLLAWCPWP